MNRSRIARNGTDCTIERVDAPLDREYRPMIPAITTRGDALAFFRRLRAIAV